VRAELAAVVGLARVVLAAEGVLEERAEDFGLDLISTRTTGFQT